MECVCLSMSHCVYPPKNQVTGRRMIITTCQRGEMSEIKEGDEAVSVVDDQDFNNGLEDHQAIDVVRWVVVSSYLKRSNQAAVNQ